MPASCYPLFINHELNKLQVCILKDNDGEDDRDVHPMVFCLTLRFIFHRIVSVDYEHPR